MKKYTIRPGQTNWRPYENPLPRLWVKGFEVRFRFAPSCWWSQEDWQYDLDREDWNKLKGLTWYFSPNNKSSAMIAWRPAIEENIFEVTAYTNPERGRFQVTGTPVLIKAGEDGWARCQLGKREVDYTITTPMGENDYKHFWTRPAPGVWREVGTYQGGANNEPGPFGGATTQYMEMETQFRIIR